MPMLSRAVKQAVKTANRKKANRKKLAENAGKEPPRDVRNMTKQAAIGGGAMAAGVAGKREQSKGY